MELLTSSCHGVLYPRYYGLVGTFSSKPPGGSRGVVLLSPRVWKGCQQLSTTDWYLMHYSNPSVTGGQKHTHGWHIHNCPMDRRDIAMHWVTIDSENVCWAIVEPISIFQHHGHGEQTTVTIKSNCGRGTILMAHLSPPHEHITGSQNGLRRYNYVNGILAVVAWLIIE